MSGSCCEQVSSRSGRYTMRLAEVLRDVALGLEHAATPCNAGGSTLHLVECYTEVSGSLCLDLDLEVLEQGAVQPGLWAT